MRSPPALPIRLLAGCRRTTASPIRSPYHFERLGKSLVVQAAVIQETEWRSRDETFVTFTADLESLVIGRSVATRLREILTRRSTGPGAADSISGVCRGRGIHADRNPSIAG